MQGTSVRVYAGLSHYHPIMDKEPNKRPGWGILEKYLPDATPEAQEVPYQNLLGLIDICLEIDQRIESEQEKQRRKLQPNLPGLTTPP
jgi:hypothetical protein